MRKIILMLVVVATGINLIYWTSRSVHAPATTPTIRTEQSAAVSNGLPATQPTTIALLDVPIQVSASGELIPDTRLKQLFDLLALQQGNSPVDEWKHRILQNFADQLPATALAQLQDAFERYVEFNLALQLLPMEGVPNLSAVLQRIQSLRAHYLGHYAAPMYADWSALEAFTWQYLNRMTQDRDDSATRLELEKLADALPAPVQERARNMLSASAEKFAVDDMASLQPDAYARMLQEQAAVALIETTLLFDEPSTEFMAQYEQYSEKRREIQLSDASAEVQQQQVMALRQQYFSGNDLLRVETLDRADAF